MACQPEKSLSTKLSTMPENTLSEDKRDRRVQYEEPFLLLLPLSVGIPAGGHALGGKPASVSTLEEYKPFFPMYISRSVILFGGQNYVKFVVW